MLICTVWSITKIDFAKLKQKNSDAIAWIKVNGTDIDFPVVKGTDNSYYLTHNFDKEKNIGIVANKAGLAREFLLNIKNIFLELPIWMKVGVESWNKSFVEFENGVRCLTDVPSQDSFRGFSIHCAIMDETAFIRPSIFSYIFYSFWRMFSTL